MEQPSPFFGFGPIAVILVALTAGFVLLEAYRAWRDGDKFTVPTQDFIAFMIVAGFLGAVVYSLSGSDKPQLDIMIGALIAALSAIVAFYFNQGKDKE
jgi:hypothetical protein